MKDAIERFDRYCRAHEALVGIIGGILSLLILAAAGAF